MNGRNEGMSELPKTVSDALRLSLESTRNLALEQAADVCSMWLVLYSERAEGLKSVSPAEFASGAVADIRDAILKLRINPNDTKLG